MALTLVPPSSPDQEAPPTDPASEPAKKGLDTQDPSSPENQDPTSIPTALSDGTTQLGSFNVCIGVLGAPGTGKSTYALARAMDLGRLPCYVFAHDLGFKLKPQLPNGKPTNIIRHGSFEEVQERLASDPRGIHCVATEDAGEVIAFATRVSSASVEANGGDRGIPSLVLIDEAVSASDMDTYRLGNGLRSSMALRRHHHMGIIWTCQSPALLNWKVMAIGTEVVCFRLKHERDLDPLRQAGLSDEEIETIKTLPNYSYITHQFL